MQTDDLSGSAWNMTGHSILLCTMKHALSQFMYMPIIETLNQGFRSMGATSVVQTSGAGPARRASMLRRGDVLVWVGAGRGAKELPLDSLGARGIRRILYSTEPMAASCTNGNMEGWDEFWHYTLHNANLCWRDPGARRRHRYVPPGALDQELMKDAAPLGEGNAIARVNQRKAVFLGIIPRNSTPKMPGQARRRCYNTLSRELGARLTHRENVYSLPAMRQLLRTHRVFVNLHKDCGEADRPAEAVRFSALLSAGRRIISERANPADEKQFSGLVTFVELSQMGKAVASALAEDALEGEAAAKLRAAEYRQRFAPAAIFERAGLHLSHESVTKPAVIPSGPSSTACLYEPGSLELEWSTGHATGHICSIAKRSSQLNGVAQTLKYAGDSWGASARAPTTEERGLLSRLVCDGGSRVEHLEPLTGLARHPRAKVGCRLPNEASLFDISHLVLANRCNRVMGSGSGAPRSLLYDLGCSTYSKIPLCELHPHHKRCGKRAPPPPPSPPPFPARTSVGLAHGPSLPLFKELYERNCITFDHIYAWEAVAYNQSLWWRDVPVDVRSRLSFYNVPIDESAGAKGDASFLNKLRATARPEDFVVLKVDVDGGPELPIVEEIAARPELAALVDEIFFEYHFWFDGIVGPGWLIRRPGVTRGRKRRFEIVTNSTVDDAMDLMVKLRKRGIRSHFWV
jgi:hypothetical protein